MTVKQCWNLSDDEKFEYRRHVRELTAFGHRGSATANECQAAEYLANELNNLGLDVQKEEFAGCASWGWRHIIHVAVAGIAAALIWISPIASIALTIITLTSFCVEGMSYGAWLSRPIIHAKSTNVVARFSSASPLRKRLIVCGHYDTQRTGIIWKLIAWLSSIQWMLPVYFKAPLLPIASAMLAQLLVGWLAELNFETLHVVIALVLAIYFVYLCLLLEWSLSKFVPGAADNASGVAGVLALGNAWSKRPVEGVELVLLFTGCEESGLLGATSFINRHRFEIESTRTEFINVDCIGMGPPRFLGWEVPVVGWPLRYPSSITQIAADIANEMGLQAPGPHSVPGPTDGLTFLAHGMAGVTVAGFRSRGYFPNYHQMSDVEENVDYTSAYSAISFAWSILQSLARVDTKSR